jgi:hypothetical protein
MQCSVCHENSGYGAKRQIQSKEKQESARWAVEEHEGSNACTGKRTSWFRVRFAVGIRCTGCGEFSDGFVKKPNAGTKKRTGSATWKTTEKGKSFAERLGEGESKIS